jgi:hypothetical protein
MSWSSNWSSCALRVIVIIESQALDADPSRRRAGLVPGDAENPALERCEKICDGAAAQPISRGPAALARRSEADTPTATGTDVIIGNRNRRDGGQRREQRGDAQPRLRFHHPGRLYVDAGGFHLKRVRASTQRWLSGARCELVLPTKSLIGPVYGFTRRRPRSRIAHDRKETSSRSGRAWEGRPAAANGASREVDDRRRSGRAGDEAWRRRVGEASR